MRALGERDAQAPGAIGPERGGARSVMNAAAISLFVDVATVNWVERRPGVFWKVLWEEGDRKAILMRYAAGAVIPRHRHLGDEQILVIEGSVADDAGVCTAGNYARRPSGCVHTVRSEGGALVFAVTTGRTEVV
jgi:anti-sigma factor ChrR (cupin superfamily)